MNRFWISALCASFMAGAGHADGDRVAEDQTPSGKFLTATEVRPILNATKGNWVAVREYGGQDLLYFTHLLSWRCGLFAVEYAINDGEMQGFDIPDCPPDIAQPNAIPDDAEIYLGFALGSVQSVTVKLLYDDLGTDEARFERASVLLP